MFAEICEMNHIEYLQKLIRTERNQNYATKFTTIDSPHQALSNHLKN